jgi:ferrous iron transport protein A
MNWADTYESTGGREPQCELCPLSRVKAGVAVRIKRLCAAPELQNRLRELGLGEDQIIKLLTSQTNFICQVCNARLAISQQLAQLILVEPLRSTVV